MKYELHPLCALFPRMPDSEYEALKADIGSNGLHQPIVKHGKSILDGRHRYEACTDLGIEPKFVEFDGEDPLAYVFSVNLRRRQLSQGQMAAIVASAQNWAEAAMQGGTGANQYSGGQTGNVAGLQTVAHRAALAGVSEKTQRNADLVAKAAPELLPKVRSGEIKLTKAVAIARPKKPGPDLVAGEPALGSVGTPADEADDLQKDPNQVVVHDAQTDQHTVCLAEVAGHEAELAIAKVKALESEINGLKEQLKEACIARDTLRGENAYLKVQNQSLTEKLRKLEPVVQVEASEQVTA